MERLTAALEVAVGFVAGLERHVEDRAAGIAEATIREVRAAADARVAEAERLAADAEDRRAGLADECERQAAAAARVLGSAERERDTARRERDEARRHRDAAEAAHAREVDRRTAAESRAERLEAERDDARAGLAEACRGLAEACRLIEAGQAAAWSPRAWHSRPLTPDQERAAAAGEGRTDWPVLIAPCDPAVSEGGGGALWLVCTGDGRAEGEHPTIIREVEAGDRWSELVAAVAPHRCGEVVDVPRESG
jgi:hypothetical protein